MFRLPWPLLTLTVLTGSCLLMSCHHHRPAPQPSFYYWRSVFRLDATETAALQTHHIRKLYAKLADIAWDETTKSPHPIALLKAPDPQIHRYSIVPVVFITNETLVMIDSIDIPDLAAKIVRLLTQWQIDNHMQCPAEIQYDCDWTARTRDRYFDLLRETRHRLDSQGQQSTRLSATIRLYQCKYRNRTGVPPVSKGLLMCYNMGNLYDRTTRNSILSTKDLAAYTGSLDTYPLPLDIAFPIFDWKVLYRNGKYAGLVKDLPTKTLTKAPGIQSASGNCYSFDKDTTIENYHFLAGDRLRDEQSNVRDITACAARIVRQLKTTPESIILFHLDSANLVKYTDHELEDIFHSCN